MVGFPGCGSRKVAKMALSFLILRIWAAFVTWFGQYNVADMMFWFWTRAWRGPAFFFLLSWDVCNHCLYFLLVSSQALVSCLNDWIQAWILRSPLELSVPLRWWWFSRSALSDFCDPGDCNPPGSSVHGISQVKTLECSAVSFSRRSAWPRDWTCISCIAGCLLPCG